MAAEGRPVGLWHRFLAAALRGVYFGRVRVTGQLPQGARPKLVVSSHRNGAIDGFQVLAAFPRAQFLISYQLLRSPVLRALFTGIPVVRAKDVDRYGMRRDAVRDPVEASVNHLRSGGDLAIFPEGTSRFGHQPQQYHRGAARTALKLSQLQVPFDVVPVGLFYSAPERFRSVAEVRCGPAVEIPSRSGEDDGDWELRIHQVIGCALDAVSVNCPDEGTFLRVQESAVARARAGESLAESFLEGQQTEKQASAARTHTDAEDETVEPKPPRAAAVRTGRGVVRGIGLVLMAAAAPVLVAGWFAGTRADARNTVTFFRMLGGLAGFLLWAPVLTLTAVLWPAATSIAAGAAVLGWLLLGGRRFRP